MPVHYAGRLARYFVGSPQATTKAAGASPGALTTEGTICAQGRLIETGQTAAYVLEHCGSPSHQETYYVPTSARFGYLVRVDEWTYDLGPGWFPRLLVFNRGVLRRIAILSR